MISNGPIEIIGNDGGYLFKSNSKNSFINIVKNFLNDTDENKLFKKNCIKEKGQKFYKFSTFFKNKKNFKLIKIWLCYNSLSTI